MIAETHILLVDDLDENLLALSALLRGDGLVILTARSGIEALELLLVHNVALALVDVQMPDLDGFELAELMRGSERTRHVPIIFVTAGSSEQSRMFQGYDAGAVDFLFKPVEPRILRHKVRTFVELHRQRQLLADQLAALKRSEAEALKLRDELAAMLSLNETFLAVVGHDLRNPLNVVLLSTSLLKSMSDEPRQRRAIERIGSAAQRMTRMIDDLYDLTRVRMSGGIPVQLCPDIDIGELAERIVNELRPAHEDRPLLVEKSGDTRGVWDVDRLGQVLSNLVGNALRHGTPSTTVRVIVDGTQISDVIVSVQNRGQIPAEFIPYLFEPFRRGPSSQREGLGLGLFIVQHLVKAHGGEVDVFSCEDHTAVRVRLLRNPTSAG